MKYVIRNFEIVLLGLAMCGIGFWRGEEYGRKYSKNPMLIQYQEQNLVLRPRTDVLCPENHSCQWKAFDMDTNTEVKP